MRESYYLQSEQDAHLDWDVDALRQRISRLEALLREAEACFACPRPHRNETNNPAWQPCWCIGARIGAALREAV